MKKLFVAAVALMAAASLWAAPAGSKKDKKKKHATTEAVQKVVPVTAADSLSYAAGLTATQGLLTYLQGSLRVDTAYLADFVRGYKEAVAKGGNPAFVAYMAGTQIAEQARRQILPGMNRDLADTPDSLRAALFHEGFVAGVVGDTAVYSPEAARERFESTVQTVREERNKAYKAENEAWLADNATKPGVQTMPSGLQYKVLKAGTGAKPTKEQTVEVVYEGKTIDGNVFDATSRHQGQKTDVFRCDQVIAGWTEALTNMPVGSKWEIYIPQELAYGGRDAGNIKPYSTLIFTVELVSIQSDGESAKAQKK